MSKRNTEIKANCFGTVFKSCNNTIDTNFLNRILILFRSTFLSAVPVQATITSRRVAYFTFFLCSYIIYTYYTSNLLSHLVNDKDNDMDLEFLTNSDYKLAVLKDMEWYQKGVSMYNNGI